MPYPNALDVAPTTMQANNKWGVVNTTPDPLAPTGKSTSAPIARPTPRPATPRSDCATAEPNTMYIAHITDAIKIHKRPSGSLLSSTPPSAMTPSAANPSAQKLRTDFVRTAATTMGPMNSIVTLLPRGSRSIPQ